jgi:AraC-like DNA-binding protein
MSALIARSKTEFVTPALPVQRYISSYYLFRCDAGDNGEQLEDLIHPEWPSARYTLEGVSHGGLVTDQPAVAPLATMMGPTSKAVRICCDKTVMFGVGLLPLGWYRLTQANAALWANQACDIEQNPEFAVFAKIWNAIRQCREAQEIAQIVDDIVLRSISGPDPLEADIEAVHMALTDADTANVAELSEVTGISSQRLERLCRRVFGFPPKRLLRRQRFLRTLANVLMEPDLKWSAALDDHYFDQAHFNRDFQEFMGMSPTRYLTTPRPISSAAVQARARKLGDPLQGLQRPGLLD